MPPQQRLKCWILWAFITLFLREWKYAFLLNFGTLLVLLPSATIIRMQSSRTSIPRMGNLLLYKHQSEKGLSLLFVCLRWLNSPLATSPLAFLHSREYLEKGKQELLSISVAHFQTLICINESIISVPGNSSNATRIDLLIQINKQANKLTKARNK